MFGINSPYTIYRIRAVDVFDIDAPSCFLYINELPIFIKFSLTRYIFLMQTDDIIIQGAKEHNLKNIDLRIPQALNQ